METQRLGLDRRSLGPDWCLFSDSLEVEGVAHEWQVECEYRREVLPHGSWSLKSSFHIVTGCGDQVS